MVQDSDKLQDKIHRPLPRGVKNRVQFINHDKLEDNADDNESTKTNE